MHNQNLYRFSISFFVFLLALIQPYHETFSSNVFDVQDLHNDIDQNNANLTIKITDNDNIPIDNADITLLGNIYKQDETLLIAPQNTANTNEYKFNNIPVGSYYLEIKKPAYQKIIKEIKITPKTSNIISITLQKICGTKKITPVLFIPGVFGTYSKNNSPSIWEPYPRLPPISPSWDNKTLKVFDPLGYVGWHSLVKEFQKYGYIENCTIFNVPYDWSLPIPDICDKYLIPWINYVKKISGSDTVDIIAYSMGGLVARTYIQSDSYENDVRKLAMVGVPNKGVTPMYYIWESNDPIILDEVSEHPAGLSLDPITYLYANILDYFYYDRYWEHLCAFDNIRRYKPIYCDKDKVHKMIRANIPSTKYGMPIYDYALLNDGNRKEQIPIIEEENTFLKALNNLTCFNPKGCLDVDGKNYSFKAPKIFLLAMLLAVLKPSYL